MKNIFIALFMMAAGPANAQDYRTIDLSGITFQGHWDRQDCRAWSDTLSSILSYFSEDGASLTFSGSCTSGSKYDETDLDSYVRTPTRAERGPFLKVSYI